MLRERVRNVKGKSRREGVKRERIKREKKKQKKKIKGSII